MVTAAGGARQIGPPICVVAPPAFSLVLLLSWPGLFLVLSCPPRRHRRRPFVAALRPGYDPQIIDPRSRVVTLRRVTISTASVVTVS